jgi:hypothetical protein
MMFIKNTGSQSEFRVSRIVVSANNAAVITRLHIGLTGTPTGDNTTGQVFSMTSGSTAVPSNITADVWDETGTGITGLTGGTVMDCWAYAAGTWHTDYDDRLILPAGANMALSCLDGAGTSLVYLTVELVEIFSS